jgi:enoyl-CoA hydratase
MTETELGTEVPARRSEWVNFDLQIADRVARILIRRPAEEMAQGRRADPHWELYEIFNQLRLDNSVRVVMMSGVRDGEFWVPVPPAADGGAGHMRQNSKRLWKASTAIVRLHQTMAELDRPIVAKVNGDALALGSSIMFSCDLIVAREDARIADTHLGMGEVEPYRSSMTVGVLPGDGGASLLPLVMSPYKAKEYLMLAREYTGADLAQMGIINAAVPAERLDDEAERLVAALLRRPAFALAWTKRVANKHVVDQLNHTLDPAIAYELVNMYEVMVEGEQSFDLE